MFDLPGHADEIYAVDWSPDGEKVASGSKDRMLRIWRNWQYTHNLIKKYLLVNILISKLINLTKLNTT